MLFACETLKHDKLPEDTSKSVPMPANIFLNSFRFSTRLMFFSVTPNIEVN